MVGLIAFIVVIGVLVFVHEFGHYAVAKLCGVRVEVFSLGFGKRLLGFRRGDTDYRISLLPLGGYVKMAGENPMESRTGDPGEFMSHPRWQRFLIAIAGPVMNVLLAFVVFTGVFMVRHAYPAYLRRPAVIGSVTAGSPAEKAGFLPGDKIVKIQGIENPTWEQVPIRILLNANQQVDVTVQRGAQLLENKIVPQPAGEERGGDAGGSAAEVITVVEPGRPAARAGIKPGDMLLTANNTPIKEMKSLVDLMQTVKDQPMQLALLRDGKELNITVKPALFEGEQQYRIGMSGFDIEKLSFSQAATRSYQECKTSSLLIFELVGRMIRHKGVSFRQISGPIGIGKIAGEAIRADGLTPLFTVMAFVSINLAIFNLFPIPILDGGLMLMLLIEGIMRRDIKQEVKERVYQVAFVFLIVFAAVVIYNDVAKTWPGHLL